MFLKIYVITLFIWRISFDGFLRQMREDQREGEATHSPLNFTLFILHLHKFLTIINVRKGIDRHSGVGANSIKKLS